jgi:transposase
MWKAEHRSAVNRGSGRYPSDLTDPEWTLIESMIPPARRGGRPRDVNVREVLNAICYVLETGCQWKALPKDMPPKSTAHYYFILWGWDGTLERIWDALYVPAREAGREASTMAASGAQQRRSSLGQARGLTRGTRWLKKPLCA